MEHSPDKKNKRTWPKNGLLKKLSFAFPILFVVVLAVIMPTHAAHAGILGSLINFGYNVIGKVVFFIGYVISYMMGIFIGIEAWLIGVILNMNDNVFQSAIVQTGFSASLSLANLGFVFGIIIIAIATILRSQTYGVKQILWKLVVMAILINFGLVIMGTIFNFADQFTSYFLACIDPTGGGCNGAKSGLSSDSDFATSIAGAFNPQRSFTSVNSVNQTIGTGVNNGGTATSSSVFASSGTDISKMLVPIFSVFFIAASLIVMVITLAAFIIMLLIRYVYIAILAVLLPFAWMLWIFPETKNNFDKWWHAFIKWTIFAPVSLFFIWLALTTAHGISSGYGTGTQNFAQYYSSNDNVWGSISGFFGNLITPIIQNLLNEIVLVGLMVGGMIAANSLGITAANGAIAYMQKTGKGVGNYAKNYAKGRARQAATAPLRTEKARAGLTSMQQRKGIKGLPSRWMGRLGESIAVGGGEKAAAEHEKGISGLTKEQALNQLTTSSAPRRQAILKRAEKEGWHDDARLDPHLAEGKMGEAKRYGNEKTFGELRDKSGRSLVDAIKAKKIADETKDPDKIKEADEKISGEVKKLGTKNPDALASFFVSDNAREKIADELGKKGIAVPVTLQPESIQGAQKEIVKTLPTFSQFNASSLLTEISKKNNLPQFEKAAASLTAEEKEAAKKAFEENTTLMKWVKKGSYRTMVDLNKAYGLGVKTEDDEKEGKSAGLVDQFGRPLS